MEIRTEWDFSELTKIDFTEERKKIEKAYTDFRDKWKNNLEYLEKPEILKKALDEYENLERNFLGNEGYYYHLLREKEQDNVNVRAKFNQAYEFLRNLEDEIRFFVLNLGKIPNEKKREFSESDLLKEYDNFLKVLFDNAKYKLTEGEEKILSLKSTSSNSLWIQMVESLLSKETRKVLDSSGEIVEKTYPEMISLMQNSNKKIRDSSAMAFNEILDKYVEVAEFEINAILEDKKVNDKIRGFLRPDESRHKEDLIETEIVDSLVECVSNRGFDISRRFYNLKARLLGLEKIKYYERAAMYGRVEKEFPYDKSVEIVKKVLYKIDNKFGEIFDMYLEKGQIDAFPKRGKNGGAFCSGWSLKNPTYILLNHSGTLRNVTTIAHEVGHGINNELMKEKQNALYFDTPKSTAEVASTFMEDFVLEELSKEINEEEKLVLYAQKLDEEIATIMRQIALYNFEKELHETYRKENYLSKEKIAEMFIKNMKNYMGDSVDCSEAGNWWTYWSHIRAYFYVYSYASGLLISKAMQKMVRQNKSSIEKVKEFLSAGTSKSPKEIFMEMGIDISDKEFWNKGLDEIENLLNETEKLARKLGKI